jgi:ubiquinone/menaquinone biosynthesis C-methylase UbiE
MSAEDYRYRSLIVETWDLLRGDTSGWDSRPYFFEIIRQSGEPALDVACGTGRILLDYLAEEVDIDGVDFSPEMIAVCREKAAQARLTPNLFVGDMATLNLPRRYRTLIVPSSSFLHLTDPTEARQALHRFLEHLEPGGTLAMSMRVFEPEPGVEEFKLIAEAERPGDGAQVQQWFRCWYDTANRLQSTEYRYDVLMEGKIVQTETFTNEPDLTWYPVREALDLVASAGFIDVRAHNDFTFDPAPEEAISFIVLGRMPA